MILVLCVRFAGSIHWYLYAYAPSNILLRFLWSPNGRRGALPVSAALASGYVAATAGLNTRIEADGPGWLNLLALLCSWNAIKFTWLGVASVVAASGQLLRHRSRPPVQGVVSGRR